MGWRGSARANAPAGKELRAGRSTAAIQEARHSVPLFQLFAWDHPPRGDGVCPFSPEPAQRGGPAGRARDRHL